MAMVDTDTGLEVRNAKNLGGKGSCLVLETQSRDFPGIGKGYVILLRSVGAHTIHTCHTAYLCGTLFLL